MVSEKKIFWRFSHYKFLGAIYEHGGHLDLRTMTICTNFQSPFNTSSTWSLKKFGPAVSEEKSFKCVNGRMDRRMGSDHNSYPEPSAQVS